MQGHDVFVNCLDLFGDEAEECVRYFGPWMASSVRSTCHNGSCSGCPTVHRSPLPMLRGAQSHDCQSVNDQHAFFLGLVSDWMQPQDTVCRAIQGDGPDLVKENDGVFLCQGTRIDELWQFEVNPPPLLFCHVLLFIRKAVFVLWVVCHHPWNWEHVCLGSWLPRSTWGIIILLPPGIVIWDGCCRMG